jgi:tetratricopeptide (TPR) repeat protein
LTLLVLLIVFTPACATLRRNRTADPILTSRQLALRGADAVQQKRLDEAASLFEGAIAANPADERPHRQYSEVLWQRGRRDEAIRQMEESLRLSAGDPEVRVRLGQMYMDRGDLEQAWNQATAASAAHRQLASAWALRGDIENRKGRMDEALTSYHRALSFEPRMTQVQIAVAEIYRKQNNPQRALATLQLMEEQYGTEPVPPEVLKLQGLAFKAQGRYRQAIRSLALASSADPSDVELLYQLADAHFQSGDLTNAGLVAQAALAQNPNDEASRRILADVQASQQHLTAGLHPSVRGY